MKGGVVTKKAAENLLRKEYGRTYELSGLASESKFMSSMSSYGKLCRIFGAITPEFLRTFGFRP